MNRMLKFLYALTFMLFLIAFNPPYASVHSFFVFLSSWFTQERYHRFMFLDAG